MNEMKLFSGIAAFGVALVTVLTLVFGGIYSIDQGERGVILRGGTVVGVADPGYNLKLPLVDDVVTISIQTNSRLYESLPAYSRDQQAADLAVSVTYAFPADAVTDIYAQFGSESNVLSRLVDRQVNEAVRAVFGQYNAVDAVQHRERLATDIRAAIIAAIQGPILISGVQLENIDFSHAYEQSIEQRMLAEVEVQRVRQNADRTRVEAEIRVIQAEADAAARLAQATAEAQATRLAGEAEADAIRARGDALRANPELIQLVASERWDGRLPTSMIPGGAVPFLNLTPGAIQ